MLQILVRAGSIAALTSVMACGQQGPLYLPQTDGYRAASLPESLLPAKASATGAETNQPVAVPVAAQ